MRFSRRRATEPYWDSEVPGLARFAASRGWEPITGDPFTPSLSSIIHRLSWVLHDRRYPGTLLRASVQDETVFRDVYRGFIDDRRVVTTNAWTNIGPQQLVKLYEMKGVSVCAVELASLSPIMLVQTRRQPTVERYPTKPTGNPEFDQRFSLAVSPGLDARVITPELQQQIMAHDDWAFAGHESWLACVRRGPFQSADDVRRRLEELTATVDAFPASVVPAQIDRSADDLLARVQRLSSPEEVIGFLQQLSPDDRQRLAQSNTPLAAFADVTTWEQVMSRLQTLDVPQRMQLLAMFKRAKGDEQT